MSAILVPTLYATAGICVYTALNQGLAFQRRRAGRIHLVFALMSLMMAGVILARLAAYGSETVDELILMRRWEVSFFCAMCTLFVWFVADYTGVRPRKLLLGLSAWWALVLVVNWALPYGAIYADLPHLSYFTLPWGERVVDLRVLQGSVWHKVGWVIFLIGFGYGLFASRALYRQGQQKRARVLAWAIGIFLGFSLAHVAVNLGLVKFVHVAEFGYVGLIMLMDLELNRESRDQNRRLHAVLDHFPASVFMMDPQGQFKMVNRKFESVFAISEKDLVGKDAHALFPAAQAAAVRASERQAIATRQDVESVEVLERGGETRILQTVKFPLFRNDGALYALGGVCIDITESLKKDEQLNKYRRQVWHADRVASTGAITASLAHELCQPLFAILSNAQAGLRFLAQEKVDLQEIRELLEDIVRDEKRAGNVINGLRAMLQQQESPLTDIDLGRCVEEVFELLHTELVRHDVEVERTLESNLMIHANQTQIQQVLLNLTINAMEAMDERPVGERSLRVNAERREGSVLVSICDSGSGIAADMLDRVFDGFYTTKPQGLGVGLEVCRSILETHHGKIWADANPDRGVTFRFTVPLVVTAAR